jgi:hypothetical protein
VVTRRKSALSIAFVDREAAVTASLARGGAILVAILISIPALAETPRPASPPASPKALDPNEVICEKQEVIGSRLQKQRVCMTRAKWADLKLQDRQNVERVQSNQGLKGE